MGSETSLPNLFCEEDESSLSRYCDNRDEKMEFCYVSEPDSQFVETLFQKETDFRSENDGSSVRRERKWLKCARSDVIKWILEKKALFGYHNRTAYLALIYFDRFLSRTWISDGKVWHIRILSIACLSLAAKMEESQARSFREYTVEGCYIDGNLIQRMELIVLDTLEWEMVSVTPFTYLNYFAAKLCGECRDEELLIRAAEFISAIVEEINVVEHRPSVVAAAAVLAAYDNHLAKAVLEKKMDAIPSWGTIEKAHTFSCYCQLQEILELNFDSLPSYIVHDSAVALRSTRRRLDLDDRDQRP